MRVWLAARVKQHAAPVPGWASKFNHLFILKSSTSAVTWWCKTCQAKRLRILVTLLGVHQSASMYTWYAPICVCLLHDRPFQPKSIASPTLTNTTHSTIQGSHWEAPNARVLSANLRPRPSPGFHRQSPCRANIQCSFRRMLEVADHAHLVHDVHGGVAHDRWNKHIYIWYIYFIIYYIYI